MSADLKKYRRARGMTQQQVADMLGVDRTTYTLYENKKVQPSVEKLKKLAGIFGVSIVELLDPIEESTETLPLISPNQILSSSNRSYDASFLEDCKFLFRFRLLTDEAKQEVLEYMETKPLRQDYLDFKANLAEKARDGQSAEAADATDAPAAPPTELF